MIGNDPVMEEQAKMFDHTEWQRKRRRDNPERDREYSRKYYWRHKDDPTWQKQRKVSARRHYDLHKEERIAKACEWHRRLKAAAIEFYGKVCVCCGESNYEFLCIDHINGGGNKHRKQLGCSRNFFSWLRKNGYPEGFRTLCHNCNQSFGYNGYCPHQRMSPTGSFSFAPPSLGLRNTPGRGLRLAHSVRESLSGADSKICRPNPDSTEVDLATHAVGAK
jgi:hypothetical protein